MARRNRLLAVSAPQLYQFDVEVIDVAFGGVVAALGVSAGLLMLRTYDIGKQKQKGSPLAENLCKKCFGLGRVKCVTCVGTGTTDSKVDGKFVLSRCSLCTGAGRLVCPECSGKGLNVPKKVKTAR